MVEEDEYKNSTDKNLVEFARGILAGDRKNATQKLYVIGEVSNNAAQDIEKLTGINVSGFEHVIDGSHIGHYDNRHGKHGQADQSMKDPEDIGRVKYVLDNYDKIELSERQNHQFRNSDGTRSKVLLYTKRINGNYYVTEAVPDAKSKKLRIISIRKNKAAGTGHGGNHPAVLTSETPAAATNNI